MDLNKRAFNIPTRPRRRWTYIWILIIRCINFQSGYKSCTVTRRMQDPNVANFLFDSSGKKKKGITTFFCLSLLAATNIFRHLVRFVIKTSYRGITLCTQSLPVIFFLTVLISILNDHECICISSEINLVNIRWKINIFSARCKILKRLVLNGKGIRI